MDDGNAQSHVMMMQGGSNPSMLGMVPMLQGMDVADHSADMHHLSTHTKTENDSLVDGGMPAYNRRNKVKSSSKYDNVKGDEKIIKLHTRVQDVFAANLVHLVCDDEARNLQCCVTYGKPCGCIRKFILAGPQWKESSKPNLRVGSMKDKELESIVNSDCTSLGEVEVARAKELLGILRHAAELKKEKCYVTTENVDGKPVKELRGMIGLGNGRKRSKKYEDFVLDKRAKLREEYSLCEKAAQKLLGYSINFLYKKLRTNPQRTSRLVATNKAERAAKGPRNLIPLEQLREMANNQQSANQCCCRNCISWLVKRHFDKIVNWRKRLEGSGQRVAQQIVAEVLLASVSLDGQNSFCQNLVHWVTGCSFKKIRRVRDHLKKDPKSLPEHGLKKYWKEKGKKTKARTEDQNKNLLPKTEKLEPFATGGQGLERFPVSYDPRSHSDPNNLNNSNNRYDNEAQFIPKTVSPPPPNRTLPAGVGTMFSAELSRARHLSRESMPYQHLQRPLQQGHSSNQSTYLPPDNRSVVPVVSEMGNTYSPSNFNPSLHTPSAFHDNAESGYDGTHQICYKGTMTISDGHGGGAVSHPVNTSTQTIAQERPAHESEASQYHAANPPDQVGADHNKFYPTPFIAGLADSAANFDPGQGYYFAAANPGNSQEGFIPAGPIPFFLTQAQQVDPSNADQEGNAPSQFILLSPALPNSTDKNGGEFENFKQMMMPLTPIQMYPASYFHGGVQGENKGTDGQHFAFSASDQNTVYHGLQPQEQDVNYPQNTSASDGTKRSLAPAGQEQAYFQPLAPLAVMQPQNSGFFSGWLATHPPVSMPSHPNEQKKTDGPEQYANQQKYYSEEVPPVQDPYMKTEKTQLPAMSQWVSSSHNQAFVVNAQQPANQWMDQHNTVQEQKKPFVQQVTTQPPMLQPNSTVHVSTSDTKASLRDQMPPLAPLQNTHTAKDKKATPAQAFSSLQDVDTSSENALPKASAISDRSKRFSRERLGANIDSPGIILPPMTPLTPALTPLIASVTGAGLRSTASSVKDENQSVSTSDNQPSEDNVFRFPPAYYSRHVDSKQELVATDSKMEDNQNGSEDAGDVSQATGTTQRSLPGDTGIMVSLSNVKPAPVLSFPPTFPDDAADSKPKTSEAHTDQQLQTPTAVLNTPTHQLTPHLSTPTHQLHTPNQALNTPTQPLNTPTQSMNTPTQAINNDDHSPIKRLMPVPASKKRKADNNDTDGKSPKQSRPDIAFDSLPDAAQVRHEVASESSSVNFLPKASKQLQSSSSDERIEVRSDDEDSSLAKKHVESTKSTTASEESSALSKTGIAKPVPPTFSLPSVNDDPPHTPHAQLNTPVFVPTSVVLGKMNAGLLRRGSVPDKGTASTPQYFTFMPSNTGLSSPMFFAPIHPKTKAFDSADDLNEKSKPSPLKRGNINLNLSSKSLSEDGLQTPSKIPVVTPSAIIGGGTAEAPQMFSFQDIRVCSTPEKNKHTSSNAESARQSSERQNNGSRDDSNKSEAKKFRLPSLVVDPPSDSENSSDTSRLSKASAIQNQSKLDVTDKSSPAKTPPSAGKPSLHRTRSGSKNDLVLSLNNVNSTETESFNERSTSSPLNTPSGIQVITPTLPGAKMTSPSRRGTPKIRGRPQPIMMAPICLTSGNNTSQVATPTFFHIISPNQLPPSSPSVLMYPYPARGSGPLSTGSIASPAFGFLPKGAAQTSGSNSASLLKSALMRKLPVFQFPPPVPASTSSSDLTASDRDSDTAGKEHSKPDEHAKADRSETSTSPPTTGATSQNDPEKNRH